MFISRVFLTSFHSSSSFHCHDVTELLTEKELYSSFSFFLSVSLPLCYFSSVSFFSSYVLWGFVFMSIVSFSSIPIFCFYSRHDFWETWKWKRWTQKTFTCPLVVLLSDLCPSFHLCPFQISRFVSYSRFVWLKVFHSSFSSLVWNPCLFWQSFVQRYCVRNRATFLNKANNDPGPKLSALNGS